MFFVRAGRPAAVAKGDNRPGFKRMADIDWVATVLVLAAVTCLVLATTWGGSDKGWGDGSVIACLVVCVVLIPIITVYEMWLGDRAMILTSLFRNFSFDAIIGRYGIAH